MKLITSFYQNIGVILFIVFSMFFSCKKISSDGNYSNIENNTQINESVDYSIQNIEEINNPMNNLDISKIILKNNLGNDVIFKLNNDSGSHSYNFGMNKVGINYFKRDTYFDSAFLYEYGYDLDFFNSLDKGINDGISEFPHWYFHNNIRKEIINNIVLVDAFSFCGADDSIKKLARSIFITTNNYNIILVIRVTSDDEIKNIYNNIIFESPEYFIINFDTPYKEFAIMWNDINSIINFGNDLINLNHRSESATEWYNETENILRNLQIE